MMSQPSPPRWQHSVRTFFTVLFHELPGLLALNLVFLCSCLPVVTFGPALAALNRTADDVLQYRSPHPVRSYWTFFRERLSASIPWGLLFLGLFGVMAFSFLYYSILFSQSLLFLPLGVVVLAGLLALFSVGLHFFPALTAGTASGGETLRAAARTALSRLPGTLAAAFLSLAVLAALVLTFPVSVPVFLCLGGSVPALLCAQARDTSKNEEI